MSQYPKPHEPQHVATPPNADASVKAPWHAPTLEEVDYSTTEAAPGSVTYDFTFYAGSF